MIFMALLRMASATIVHRDPDGNEEGLEVAFPSSFSAFIVSFVFVSCEVVIAPDPRDDESTGASGSETDSGSESETATH